MTAARKYNKLGCDLRGQPRDAAFFRGFIVVIKLRRRGTFRYRLVLVSNNGATCPRTGVFLGRMVTADHEDTELLAFIGTAIWDANRLKA